MTLPSLLELTANNGGVDSLSKFSILVVKKDKSPDLNSSLLKLAAANKASGSLCLNVSITLCCKAAIEGYTAVGKELVLSGSEGIEPREDLEEETASCAESSSLRWSSTSLARV
jgi:hypothetical protein